MTVFSPLFPHLRIMLYSRKLSFAKRGSLSASVAISSQQKRELNAW